MSDPRFAVHRNCSPRAMRYDVHGAYCTECDLRWPLDARRGYRLVTAQPDLSAFYA